MLIIANITQQYTSSKFFISFKEIAHAQAHHVSHVHYNLIKHAHDVSSVLYWSNKEV